MTNSNGNPGSDGPATDKHGEEVTDPTKNVLDLVEASIKRLDDLRLASDKRQDDISVIVARHRKEVSEVRMAYEEKLRKAESARIDAIRTVDVAASQQAAKDAETRASTLAATVATSAETLRTQVQAAATAATIALTAALEPIIKDIAELRRFQYEGVGGKAQVVESRAEAGGATARSNNVALYISIGIAIFFGFVSTLVGILYIIKK